MCSTARNGCARKSGVGAPASTACPLYRQSHRYGHQPAVEPHVEQLLAILAPAHLRAASRRDPCLRAGPGKRLDVDLELPRLVGLIRDPAAVGRELRAPLLELRLHHREWLPVFQRQGPDVILRLRIERVVQNSGDRRATRPSASCPRRSSEALPRDRRHRPLSDRDRGRHRAWNRTRFCEPSGDHTGNRSVWSDVKRLVTPRFRSRNHRSVLPLNLINIRRVPSGDIDGCVIAAPSFGVGTRDSSCPERSNHTS